MAGRLLCRPLGFTPLELYQFSHRFDDIYRRFRTMYCAESPETCLREVLADFRPNLGARQRHIERYGPEAAQDFTDKPVTAQWRLQHLLVPTVLELGGPLIDLTDVPTRQEIEDRHVELLLSTACRTSICMRSPPAVASSRRRSPRTFSTGVPAPSASFSPRRRRLHRTVRRARYH
jgi:RES domain